jgi:cysteine synthase A
MQGIGANFIPANYDQSIVDEVIDVSNEKAIELARRVAKEEGILAGISSGAALAGVEEYLKKNPESIELIVVILASYGERYLSTILYKDLLN